MNGTETNGVKEVMATGTDFGSIANNTLIFVFILAVIGLLGWVAWKLYKRHVVKEESVAAEAKPADPAIEAMDRLTRLLAAIEPNTSAAEAKLLDAQVAAEVLVKQILRVVERVEELERKADYVSEAIEAIHSGERDRVAYVAGKFNDVSLQALLLSPYVVTRADLKTEAFVLLGHERGSLEECAAGYGRLTTALVAQLAQARSRILGLQQQIQMLEASHPLLQIEHGFQESIKALNLRAQPALRWTAKQALPAGVQSYLN